MNVLPVVITVMTVLLLVLTLLVVSCVLVLLDTLEMESLVQVWKQCHDLLYSSAMIIIIQILMSVLWVLTTVPLKLPVPTLRAVSPVPVTRDTLMMVSLAMVNTHACTWHCN